MKKKRKILLGIISKYKKTVNVWSKKKLTGLFILNLIILLMVLLNMAEYFKPFFLVSINAIVFIGLILSIFLIGANSKSMFFISIIFWIFTTFLKLVYIDVWAERSSIYAFQSLFLGILLLIFEKD